MPISNAPRSLSIRCRLVIFAILAVLAVRPCEARQSVTVTAQTPGSTPFISFLALTLDDPAGLDYVTFTVAPKAGSVTRAVSARYSAAYLRGRGYLGAGSGVVTVPVFGLYDGYDNAVELVTGFVSGYTQKTAVNIVTPRFRHDLHRHPEVVQARTPDTSLSYDFMLIKDQTEPDTPLILDTDGAIRWVGTTGGNGIVSALYGNSIYVARGTQIVRSEFDGTSAVLADYASLGVTAFEHNIEYGRDGLLTAPDTYTQYESDILEINPVTGQAIRAWDLAAIIRNAMVAGGDDPSLFVKPTPVDWFHSNSVAYRASDNSLLVSSRENFIIALDYDTQAIKWILGDPGKYWYTFPSLRRYALDLGPNTHAPIGQHALSFVRDQLLLFDDGYGSTSQPIPGPSRTYSAPRKYVIDTAANTATEVWHYTAGRQLFSPVCSSVYEDTRHNFLINYATLGPFLEMELVGLNKAGAKVFDYKFPEVMICGSGWNAAPIHLENMVFN